MSKKIVKVGDINCGADELFLISGPCVIEEESTMMKTAEMLKEISERLNVPIIFKSSFQKDNRSTIENFQGPGLEEGLKMLEKYEKESSLLLMDGKSRTDTLELGDPAEKVSRSSNSKKGTSYEGLFD